MDDGSSESRAKNLIIDTLASAGIGGVLSDTRVGLADNIAAALDDAGLAIVTKDEPAMKPPKPQTRTWIMRQLIEEKRPLLVGSTGAWAYVGHEAIVPDNPGLDQIILRQGPHEVRMIAKHLWDGMQEGRITLGDAPDQGGNLDRAVAVDSGTIWIGDPCYLIGKLRDQSDWTRLVHAHLGGWAVQEPFGSELGLWIGHFGGDGTFPVTIEREGGMVKRVIVDFDPADDGIEGDYE